MQFSKADYNSNDGMGTYTWGPLIWNTLHIMSFNYPVVPDEETKNHYHEYLMSLEHVLPCKSCRVNFSKNLKMAGYNRDKLKNRDQFSRFIYDLHNVVNQMLGKPKYLTYEQIRDRYEMFRAKCVNDTPVHTRFETGCTKPNNNIKTQSVVNIVPLRINRETFVIDKKCLPTISNGGKKPLDRSYKPVRKTSKKSKKKSSKKVRSK
jgi:hypothetical protein